MRKLRPPGSVRGVRFKAHSYRDGANELRQGFGQIVGGVSKAAKFGKRHSALIPHLTQFQQNPTQFCERAF